MRAAEVEHHHPAMTSPRPDHLRHAQRPPPPGTPRRSCYDGGGAEAGPDGGCRQPDSPGCPSPPASSPPERGQVRPPHQAQCGPEPGETPSVAFEQAGVRIYPRAVIACRAVKRVRHRRTVPGPAMASGQLGQETVQAVPFRVISPGSGFGPARGRPVEAEVTVPPGADLRVLRLVLRGDRRAGLADLRQPGVVHLLVAGEGEAQRSSRRSPRGRCCATVDLGGEARCRPAQVPCWCSATAQAAGGRRRASPWSARNDATQASAEFQLIAISLVEYESMSSM